MPIRSIKAGETLPQVAAEEGFGDLDKIPSGDAGAAPAEEAEAASDEEAEAEDEDPSLRLAIEEFQCEHDLPVNGERDAATEAKLLEIHGS